MLPEIVELIESETYEVCAMVAEINHERNITLTFSVVPYSNFAGILPITFRSLDYTITVTFNR